MTPVTCISRGCRESCSNGGHDLSDTPGMRRAALASTLRMRACACGLRRMAMWSMPGRFTSATNEPAPAKAPRKRATKAKAKVKAEKE